MYNAKTCHSATMTERWRSVYPFYTGAEINNCAFEEEG
jgi:hypothetical protein